MLGFAVCLTASVARAEVPVNQLSPSEAASGWRMLFDGTNMDQWRNYQSDEVSDGWKLVDGQMVRQENGAGDLITRDQFDHFELSLEYNISKAGNSGLMFRVTEEEKKPWMTGPEIQIQDDLAGHDPQKSGWLYQLYEPQAKRWGLRRPPADATRPPGQWNQLYLRVSPTGCQVCVNGTGYYRFELGSDDWSQRVAKSKFASLAGFGKAAKGHLCLQDHGDWVAFRNIKIRELPESGTVPQPITGTLNLGTAVAFPNVEWEGWEPTDESGKLASLRLMELTFPHDDSNRLFVASQRGEIWCFENDPDVTQSHLFLDLRDQVVDFRSGGGNEQGLLGLAFHPNYRENGFVYTYYSQLKTNRSIISRWTVSPDDPNRADPNSEVVILDLEQPFQNHNGGSIEFGPDGYLYAGLGDGGDVNDPYANGQNLSTLLASIIRIDVDHPSDGRAYGIPADNPFLKTPDARPEIFAYGVRNPWRLAFDPETGRLWCSDVGQDLLEEVIVVEKGGNYGWSIREGTRPFGNQQVDLVTPPIDPVWEYDHQIGKSITGGRVYRGTRLPPLVGKYLYADYVTGSVWALTYDETQKKAVANEQVLPDSIPVLAFGQDQSGEVYFLTTSAKGQSIQRFTLGEPEEEIAKR